MQIATYITEKTLGEKYWNVGWQRRLTTEKLFDRFAFFTYLFFQWEMNILEMKVARQWLEMFLSWENLSTWIPGTSKWANMV